MSRTGTGDGGLSFAELAVMIAKDDKLKQQFIQDPAGELAKIPSRPLESDVWIYRMVVAALGLAVLGAMIGFILLASDNKEVPAGLVALGSAAVGALGGLLAPSPTGKRQ